MKFKISALILTASITASSPVLAATPGFGSSGALALVVLSVAGNSIIVPPLEPTDGTGRPAYRGRNTLIGGGLNLTLPVLAGLDPLSVIVTVPSGRTKAEGFPSPGGGAQSSGSSDVHGLTVSLQSTLLGITTSLLNITATDLKTEASSTTNTKGAQVIGTKASARNLAISGLLVGGQLIKLTGPLKKNSVVFSNALLTITIHETYSSQDANGQKAISLNGLDISLNNATVLGTLLNGHIFLNTDTAF